MKAGSAASIPPGPTGIVRLDRDLGPGADRGVLLFLHGPGTDAAPFLQQAVAHRLAAGGRVVHATTSRDPAAVRDDFARLGFDRAAHEQRVALVDLREVRNAIEVDARLSAALRPDPTALLVVESLTGLVHTLGEEVVRAWYPDARAAWGSRLAVVQLAERDYAPPTRAAFEDAAAVVRLERRERRGTRFDSFRATRRPDGAAPALRAYPYRVERPGGVRPHLAKILVTGAHSSGKTSFVHALAREGVSTELLGTTVALDHGRVERDGLAIDVFGTPGQERFDPIIEQAALGAVGVIVVVDAARPSTFPRAQGLARATAAGDVPTVYAINKQDAPGALSADDARAKLGLAGDVPVVPCIATDRRSAERVLDVLVERVLSDAARPPPAT